MTVRDWNSDKILSAANTSAVSSETADIAALTDGSFVISYVSDNVIFTDRVSADGSAVSFVDARTSGNGGAISEPALVALSNGGFASAFADNGPNAATDWTLGYSAARQPAGYTGFGFNATRPIYSTAVAEVGNNIVNVLSEGPSGDHDIVIYKTDEAGTQVQFRSNVAWITVNDDDLTGEQINGTVASFNSGNNFVVAWDDAQNNRIAYRLLNSSDGSFVAGTSVASSYTPVDSYSPPKVISLASGGFLIVWSATATSGGDTSAQSIRGSLFDQHGVPVLFDFQINTVTAGTQWVPSATALKDGGFLVVWSEDGGAVEGQQFDGLGQRVGTEFTISDDGGSDYDAHVTTLTDGRVAVEWLNYLDSELHYKIIDPRDGIVRGTPGADTLYGNDQTNDQIKGLAGSDTLYGMAGNDRLDGGDGNDSLYPGSGDDTVLGGNGADTIYVPITQLTDGDTIDGGNDGFLDELHFTTAGTIGSAAFANVSHIEKLSLADGTNNVSLADALVGSADDGHVLTVTGGSGNDTVNASAVTTSSNVVKFIAGAGNDRFTGGAGADVASFRTADFDGSDTVNGGTGSSTDGLSFTTNGFVTAAAFAGVSHVERIFLSAGASHNLTLSDSLVATADDGHLLTIVGNSGHDTVNASAVLAGDSVRFEGMGAADRFIGGSGADIFYYFGPSDSTGDANGTLYDTLIHFNPAADHFDLPSGFSVASVSTVSSGSLSGGTGTFDSDMAAAIGSHLTAHTAVDFTVTAGNLSGQEFLVVNPTASNGYVSGADYVFNVTDHYAGAFTTANFV